jgi:hypothetical protein
MTLKYFANKKLKPVEMPMNRMICDESKKKNIFSMEESKTNMKEKYFSSF